jgi:phosphoglucosamine mutase
MLQAAVSAGVTSEGADVYDLGVFTTPGVAWYCETQGIPGIVISASHNPFKDNGVKVFASGGLKLSEDIEKSIEEEVGRYIRGTRRKQRPASGHAVGRIISVDGTEETYIDHLIGSLDGRSLGNLTLAIDCANGSAWRVFPEALRRAGADVVAIGCSPDGININDDCGSTHPEMLAGEVVSMGAHMGLAVDGDGDRLVAVTGSGRMVDGDELVALFAFDMLDRGLLAGQTVAVSVMSNLGLTNVLKDRGIRVRETMVGDRHILEELDRLGLSLGGEQSGHIIFRSMATTGDGILTALMLADLVARSGKTLEELTAGLLKRVPQVLMNVTAPDPAAVVSMPATVEALREAEEMLDGTGRVLVRASGTEPLVRIMVECDDEDFAGKLAGKLAGELERVSMLSALPSAK